MSDKENSVVCLRIAVKDMIESLRDAVEHARETSDVEYLIAIGSLLAWIRAAADLLWAELYQLAPDPPQHDSLDTIADQLSDNPPSPSP